MDILSVLENALLNPDPTKRAEAEQQLNQAAREHFVEYLSLLTQAMSNEEARTEVRMLAGIGLKNQLTSKSSHTKQEQQARWMALEASARANIKELAIQALWSSDDRVAGLAAQLVAAVADIELPRNQWPELIPLMIENTKSDKPVHVKKASLLTIGYICESADPNNEAIVSQANGILIAIVQGVQSNEPSAVVRLTALNALVNSLEFIKFNFAREGERNYIMQVVCEATQASNREIQASAFGCLARIMALYYRFMALYMEKALYRMTVAGMKTGDDNVACMAVEFWLTVCEEEVEIALQREEYGPEAVGPELVSYNFALVALQDVLPTLLTLLTRQNEDPEDDDWLVAMAAGACLSLFAQNCGGYVVEPVLQFVAANITATGEDGWRQREAAVVAFGSILDGPDHQQLTGLIHQALPPILALISDRSLAVKETVAWCLGRIADMVVDAIDAVQLPQLLQAVVAGLQDHPKVATNCCWTLMNLAEQLCANAPGQQTSPLLPFYEGVVPLLMQLTQGDNEDGIRGAAYEALLALVTYSADDCMGAVQNIATEAVVRLEAAAAAAPTSQESGDDLQISLLALITAAIRRMGPLVAGAPADNLMQLFLKLLASNKAIEEDVYLAVSAVAGSVGGNDFLKYMDAFAPVLKDALQHPASPACNTAVGLVADLAHALGPALVPYLDGFMPVLGANLNDAEVRRDLRPAILSCFGDIATGIGQAFQPYLEFVMQVCASAAAIEFDDSSLEIMDYVLSVKEAVLDCYVGIVGGMSDSPDKIFPYVANIFLFLRAVAGDINMAATELVARLGVGLLGDLAAMYPNREISQAYREPWVTEFIKRTRSSPNFGAATKDAARWARDQQKRQVS